MSTLTPKSAAIIGLGYVGLPLAVLARQQGWQVIGLDIDQNKIDLINQGQVPFADQALQTGLNNYPISAATDPSQVASVEVIIIAVPTPVNTSNEPDLTPITSALQNILPHLSAGQTLIIESTINPGVMDEIIVPLLQTRSDLPLDAAVPDSDLPALFLAHCPERVNPGDDKWTVKNIPRVLGGYSRIGTQKARDFYADVIDAPIKIMGSATEAEAVKILENTFRDINIAYINEMARSFDALGIDIINVIAGAATKPFAFMPHYPGNGVGGHCISVDPYYMIARGKQVGFDHQFLKLARQINEDMPQYTVDILKQDLKKHHLDISGSSIAVLGLAYKKDVSDTRNSPALKTVELLKAAKANVVIFDPFLPDLSTVKSLNQALDQADAIILACDHTDLVNQLTPQTLKKAHLKIIIDAKNALDHKAIKKTDLTYSGIGRS